MTDYRLAVCETRPKFPFTRNEAPVSRNPWPDNYICRQPIPGHLDIWPEVRIGSYNE